MAAHRNELSDLGIDLKHDGVKGRADNRIVKCVLRLAARNLGGAQAGLCLGAGRDGFVKIAQPVFELCLLNVGVLAQGFGPAQGAFGPVDPCLCNTDTGGCNAGFRLGLADLKA